MKASVRNLVMVLVMVAAASMMFCVGGCKKSEDKKAVDKVNKAVEKAAVETEKAAEAVKEAAEAAPAAPVEPAK